MVEITDIPAEVRWSLATRGASALPLAYAKVYRERHGGELGEISGAIWTEAGKTQGALARAFTMPLKNAEDVTRAFSTLSTVMLGPELKGEVQVAQDRDCARVVTTSCPYLSRAGEMGEASETICPDCRAYCTAAVESLNPAYGIAFGSRMCLGGETCQMTIEPKR
ncbi:MAG: hypothetical protein PHP59_10760 [Methanofollis sp.]|uniref:hypothetical protein n=1 Tax=Methanofollis sp. TaxID=2052835 RepID=UPI002635A794|nr:hypothetical protein [Methanofollis sp.]MDD4255839.1 hypothetical protein [Methanofollis sp.]